MNDRQLLEAAARAAGGLDWEWWTSNSYRRLTFKQGQASKDGSALQPFKNQADGWPDVSMAPGVQEFIERASPAAVLRLVDRVEELEVISLPILRIRLQRILRACAGQGPKQAIGEMIQAMLQMPEWGTAVQCDPHQTEGSDQSDLRPRCEGHGGLVAGKALAVPGGRQDG